jgi:hypothetical protein
MKNLRSLLADDSVAVWSILSFWMYSPWQAEEIYKIYLMWLVLNETRFEVVPGENNLQFHKLFLWLYWLVVVVVVVVLCVCGCV